MFLFAIWTVFMLSVQEHNLPVLPPASAPVFMVQDTIPPAVPDTIPQDTIPPAVPDTLPRDTIPPAVPDSARPDTILPGAPPGANYSQQTQQEVLTDTVEVWNYRVPEGFEIGETDSTLRWTNLLNLFDRFHQKRGAITNRAGTVGRMDGLALHSFESRHLSLEMEGLDITRSLTGDVDWNRLPIHKLKSFHEAEYGATYRSEARLRDHYLTEPRTYLNFDESKFNYRSLEFSATRNFNPATNAELSFWDRRDGGGYPRSGVEGRQIVARVYHQLTDNWLLKTAFINNGMDRQESFGYVMDAPQFFLFNRFVASAAEPSADSNQSSSDIYVQAHYRKDKYEDVSSEFGLHYQTEKWNLSYSADTVATDFKKIELYARQHVQLRGTTLRGTGRLFYLNESEKQNLQETQWIGGRFDLNLTQKFTNWSRFHGFANLTAWNDDRMSSEVSGRLEVNPLPNTTLAAFGGLLSRAPDIQALYWQAGDYMGNPALRNEEAVTGGALVEFGFGNFSIGGRADYRNTENGHFADTEGNFINLAPYSQVSATGWLGLNSEILEGEISAVYKEFSPTGTTESDARLSLSGDRTWLKGHLYWKSYLFDRATFVTAGFSGMLSPNAFRTAEFLPEINRWQHGTNEYINPSYYRLDLDVSARIRWFMVLMKWENILDRVGQAGYFEAPGYPMPERRFILGLRVLFTN
ncbi:MAG: putative porin [Balneolaceae bacterium]